MANEEREQMSIVDQAKGVLAPDLTVGLQQNRVPVITHVDGYYWTCGVCGWLGTDCPSIDFAQAEAGDHFRKEHEPREVYIVRKDVR